jgi:hypothetical protein
MRSIRSRPGGDLADRAFRVPWTVGRDQCDLDTGRAAWQPSSRWFDPGGCFDGITPTWRSRSLSASLTEQAGIVSPGAGMGTRQKKCCCGAAIDEEDGGSEKSGEPDGGRANDGNGSELQVSGLAPVGTCELAAGFNKPGNDRPGSFTVPPGHLDGERLRWMVTAGTMRTLVRRFGSGSLLMEPRRRFLLRTADDLWAVYEQCGHPGFDGLRRAAVRCGLQPGGGRPG